MSRVLQTLRNAVNDWQPAALRWRANEADGQREDDERSDRVQCGDRRNPGSDGGKRDLERDDPEGHAAQQHASAPQVTGGGDDEQQ